MKTILLSIALFISILSKAQSTLTYGQVFNFDIGDVIQGVLNTSVNNIPYPPMYKTNTVLSKTVTINNDSIIYNIKIDTYSPAACQTCSPTSSSYTVNQIVTNLNSLVPDTNATTCLSTDDTTYYSNCNKKTYEVHPVYNTTCFEPTTVTTKYIEGVGLFYDKNVANAPNYAESYVLVYYMKQSGNCPVGVFIPEQKNDYKITIFPNPTKEAINLASNVAISRFDLFSLEGKIVLSGAPKNNKIDILSITNGTYILNLYSLEQKVKTIKFIKE